MFKAFEFCIPTASTKVPSGPEWLHEIKHDGFRLRVKRDGDRVRLITRGGYDDSTKRYPWIVEAALKNRQKRFVIDGEAVILGVDGNSDFEPCTPCKSSVCNSVDEPAAPISSERFRISASFGYYNFSSGRSLRSLFLRLWMSSCEVTVFSPFDDIYGHWRAAVLCFRNMPKVKARAFTGQHRKKKQIMK
jgi:hypothetical protein